MCPWEDNSTLETTVDRNVTKKLKSHLTVVKIQQLKQIAIAYLTSDKSDVDGGEDTAVKADSNSLPRF